ncbi:MAG: hypothetical protein EBU66_16565 [Bacteroidetes bacterium]|nr:hypothetical protein [Bacteroidota bacterium]
MIELSQTHYPILEYPDYRYNDDNYKILRMPFIPPISKNAPELTEARFISKNINPAIVNSVNDYLSNRDDAVKYGKSTRLTKFDYDKMERTKEQSNTIFFMSMYCMVMFVMTVIWMVFR